MKYAHLAARLFNQPLLVSADKAEVIANVLIGRMNGAKAMFDDEDDTEEISEERDEPKREGAIAIVDIAGALVHKGGWMDAMSGIQSYMSIGRMLDQAVADTNVKGILLRVDSPGGEVAGAWDCADKVYAAAQKKPVWAIAEDNALSAGYLLPSQANRLFMTQTGIVGSIGVIMMHYDLSQAEKKEGIRVTTMHRGKRKADFSPHEPLSDGAKSWADAHLDLRYEQFVSAVVRGRKISADAVRDTEAGLIDSADDAMKIGLADGIRSYDEVLQEFSAFLTNRGRRISLAAASAGANPRKEGNSLPDEAQQADAATATAELRQQIRSEVLTEVAEVAAFCEVAGCAQMTAKYIDQLAAGKTKSQVIAEIRKAKATAAAEEVEIESAITPEAGATIEPTQRYNAAVSQKAEFSLKDLQAQRLGLKGVA